MFTLTKGKEQLLEQEKIIGARNNWKNLINDHTNDVNHKKKTKRYVPHRRRILAAVGLVAFRTLFFQVQSYMKFEL